MYTEKMGINAFFIHNDCLPKNYNFKNINVVDILYNPPGYRHRNDHKKRGYVTYEYASNCQIEDKPKVIDFSLFFLSSVLKRLYRISYLLKIKFKLYKNLIELIKNKNSHGSRD